MAGWHWTATKSLSPEVGYEGEFVDPPPKQFQTECPICLLILRKPHLVSCCGNSFCATCIGRIEEDAKPCPLCKKPTFTSVANKGLERALHEFYVRCPHRIRGCDWIGKLVKLDEHVNSDPEPARQLEGCPFAVVECIHCKEGIRRNKVSDHQLEQCPQRPYTCEYCAEYKSTFEDVANNHWTECKCFPLPCPNNCALSIERQDLDYHVIEECPLTVVQCELHHAGCKVSLPRKDMADHMREDSVTHISLLAAENLGLRRRLLDKDEQILLLEGKVAKQAQELSQTSQELVKTNEYCSRLAHNLTETKVKIRQLSNELTRDFRPSLEKQYQHISRATRKLRQAEDKIASQSQDLSQIARELRRSKERFSSQSRILNEKISDISEYQELAMKQIQVQQQHNMQKVRAQLELQSCVAPLRIKMDRFEECKKKGVAWYSHPFCSSFGGYKLRLRVDANGCGDGADTFVAVFIYLMCGEFDSQLKWPFRGTITIQLINQLEDKEHYTHIYHYTDETPDDCAALMIDNKRSSGWGLDKFIPHYELDFNLAQNCQYLKDDCLVFRVDLTIRA